MKATQMDGMACQGTGTELKVTPALPFPSLCQANWVFEEGPRPCGWKSCINVSGGLGLPRLQRSRLLRQQITFSWGGAVSFGS